MNQANIHATCVAIGTRGVLLLGASGAGKSALALRLIDDGAMLVADDRTILSMRRGGLVATAPASIRGLLEIRGLGIVQYPVRASVTLALAVRLGRNGVRLPAARFYRPPAALKAAAPVPLILLDGGSAAAPARIRAALRAFSQGLFRDTFYPH